MPTTPSAPLAALAEREIQLHTDVERLKRRAGVLDEIAVELPKVIRAGLQHAIRVGELQQRIAAARAVAEQNGHTGDAALVMAVAAILRQQGETAGRWLLDVAREHTEKVARAEGALEEIDSFRKLLIGPALAPSAADVAPGEAGGPVEAPEDGPALEPPEAPDGGETR